MSGVFARYRAGSGNTPRQRLFSGFGVNEVVQHSAYIAIAGPYTLSSLIRLRSLNIETETMVHTIGQVKELPPQLNTTLVGTRATHRALVPPYSIHLSSHKIVPL